MKKYPCVIFLCVWGLFCARYAYAESEGPDSCDIIFRQTGECATDRCKVQCLKNAKSDAYCSLHCLPKICFEFEVKDCPKDHCQVLKGCNQEDACYGLLAVESSNCGGLAYSGQSLECCEGFVKRCGVEFFDGTCDMIGQSSMYVVPICIPCGNGVCEQFENRCNCPEDCGAPTPALSGTNKP